MLKRILTALVTLILLSPLYAQDKIKVEDIVYEKIFLHVDRDIYTPNDNLWFKIYITSGIDHKLIRGYKNVYIELIDEEGNVDEHRMVLTHNGSGIGDFYFHPYFEEGTYTIRAHTKYQENFGIENYYQKKIQVLSLKSAKEAEAINKSNEIDIGFYPESGDLVYEVNNFVAFKAVDQSGRGVFISGSIIDDIGQSVVSFRSTFKGMGSFNFKPRVGKKYKVVIDNFKIPDYYINHIKAEGISFHIEDKQESFILNAYVYQIDKVLDSVIIEAEHKGILLVSDTLSLNAKTLEYSFKKAKFPLGIAKITIKSTSGSILAERIYFVQNGFKNLVRIDSLQSTYKNREKVSMSLNSILTNGDSLVSGVSVSIVNKVYLEENHYQEDLRGYLLLDSELKGPIESPASYFIDDSISPCDKLNLLTIVQGWRSYYFPEEIAGNFKSLEGWEDVGLTVSGYVKRLLREETIEGAHVTIGPFSSRFMMLDTITNSIGRFQFDRLYLRDSSTLIIQAKNERGRSNTEIILNPLFRPVKQVDAIQLDTSTLVPILNNSFTGQYLTKLNNELEYAKENDEQWGQEIEENLEQYYALAAGTQWIEEVVIRENKRFRFSDFFKSRLEVYYGKIDTTLDVSEINDNYLDIIDYFKNNPIKGVQTLNNELYLQKRETPIYLIDDTSFSLNSVKKLPFNEIGEIKIIKKGITPESQYGVIAINRISKDVELYYNKEDGTFTLNDIQWEPDPERYIKGRVTQKISGFNFPRAFYSPKYDLEEKRDKDVPDYRATLLWEPYVFLNDRKANIEFYTSDFKSEYIMLIQGVSKEGRICIGSSSFSVE